ncbi:winged helix-turn-helix transcriptional regulator, partial [Escherichia coli]|uniref:winged helix-turn-helix transcriptional regulator n=1 Tax=Escherichia coli TaxID=562 RepID=UPI003349FF8B
MAILSAIRRWHFRDGASIREIARRSGLSRNTVRKYLQSKVVEPGTVAKLAMRQPFVLFKGLTFQKLCLPGAFRPGD